MTKSDKIRALAADGLTVADIADRLGIRYQHAYNVLKRSALLPLEANRPKRTAERAPKPALLVETLSVAGFKHSGCFVLQHGVLTIDRALPKEAGVYAFAKGGVCLYVGVATMGLSKRLYFYRKPGSTQRTSQRINELLRLELTSASTIEIFTATPDLEDWRGLPIHGSAGLELGLIKKFSLPWNKRSAG